MDCSSFKSEISETLSSVRRLSFEEKKSSIFNEERVNALLDSILEFKKSFREKTQRINNINEKIEKLTWFDNVDDENLILINDLISSIKDLHSTQIRIYVTLNYIRSKGVAKKEISDFKNTIDELKDSYQDLESVFFFLPKLPDFKETTKQLSLI